MRLAHRWFLRATKMGDGDAAMDAGYDYLHGIGVRRDLPSARRMLRLAVRSNRITQYGREEALYHLAIAEIDRGRPDRAIPLLQQVNRDNDYSEAASLLAQIRAKADLNPCWCRRHVSKHLPGHAKCPKHANSSRCRLSGPERVLGTRLVDALSAARTHSPGQWDEVEIRENASNAHRNGR